MARRFTKGQLFFEQAPGFNFELSEDEILERGLKEGVVIKVGHDLYEYNPEWLKAVMPVVDAVKA